MLKNKGKRQAAAELGLFGVPLLTFLFHIFAFCLVNRVWRGKASGAINNFDTIIHNQEVS